MKKIALVAEFGDSHTELLYSHKVLLEDAGFEVVFFLNDRLKFRTSGLTQNELLFFSESESQSKTLGWLYQVLKDRPVRLLIDNSAHSNYIRNFLPYKVRLPHLKIVGVCHYVKKLKTSLNQWLISRVVDRYWVLSDMFFEKQLLQKGKRFEVFYPVYFPELSHKTSLSFPLQIAVPGGVNLKSKDYRTLFEAIAKDYPNLRDKIRVFFLGSSDGKEAQALRKQVKEANLEEMFVFFEGYVSLERFNEVLAESDLIAPLINPELDLHKDYLNSKISGAYNLCYGHKIPMLIHEFFSPYSDFKDFSVFYNNQNLGEILGQLDLDSISILRNNLAQAKKYSFEYQKQNYQRFVCLES
jgi:hypothetical protein